jgi:hypothetical protein
MKYQKVLLINFVIVLCLATVPAEPKPVEQFLNSGTGIETSETAAQSTPPSVQSPETIDKEVHQKEEQSAVPAYGN